ncbi:MAG: hypothetical protein V1728_01390 [Candidatus Micrarchaeota archaeon]
MRLLAFALAVSFILLYGCTAEEEKEFNQAVEHAAQQQAIDTIKNSTGGLIDLGGGKPAGECRFDSDCPPLCEGSVFWKRGCDAQTDKCVRTFDTDCGMQPTVLGEFSFPGLCAPGGCVQDNAAIRAKKSELVSQANGYTAAMQQTTDLRQTASRNCRSALADVTDKLIIDTALSFGRLPRSGTSIYSITTKNTIERLGKTVSGSDKMPVEEYIALNCKAVESLDADYALLAKKRDIVIEQAKAFEGR